MSQQARYDAVLVTIPALLVAGGIATIIANGTLALLTAFGTAIAAVSTVGRELFVAPPNKSETVDDDSNNGENGDDPARGQLSR